MRQTDKLSSTARPTCGSRSARPRGSSSRPMPSSSSRSRACTRSDLWPCRGLQPVNRPTPMGHDYGAGSSLLARSPPPRQDVSTASRRACTASPSPRRKRQGCACHRQTGRGCRRRAFRLTTCPESAEVISNSVNLQCVTHKEAYKCHETFTYNHFLRIIHFHRFRSSR